MNAFGPTIAQFLLHCSPGKSSQPLLKKLQSLSGPDIQIITAASATVRKRFTLTQLFLS
jgi:hypothetical protein